MNLALPLLLALAAPPADPVRITTDGSFKQHLQWSPDGKRFLFTRIHQGKMALWTMTAEGKELARVLPNHDQPHFDGHWSPDGKRIVYVFDQLQGTDGKLAIHTCATDGSDDKRLVPHKAFRRIAAVERTANACCGVSTRTRTPNCTSWRRTARTSCSSPARSRTTCTLRGARTANASPLPAAAPASRRST
ncbi:MAG: hypothetical protein U0791_22740 [Gemmataceae bacterium]